MRRKLLSIDPKSARGLLEGNNVNLKVVEKEDLALVVEWMNDPEYIGDYQPFSQQSRAELERQYDKPASEEKWFLIEKKDKSKIGSIGHFQVGGLLEIGYSLIPSERVKGCYTEATRIMVDYLLLSKNAVHIQAHTDVKNLGSQKVLEKTGFQREGIVRRCLFTRGEWRDYYLFSILRKERKEPRILTRSA